ncbi:MAG TPA: hypothetical protein VIQ30_11540 [Pseudonocardia sp.]
MGLYQTKPVTVEARQWDGTQAAADELIAWVKAGGMLAYYETTDADAHIVINTVTGPDYASAMDWVVKGVAGEFRPVRDDIFTLTYEEA